MAKPMIDSGRIGRVHGHRGRLNDHFAARGEPAAWRFDPAPAGSGVIGDIGSHTLDLARFDPGLDPLLLAATGGARVLRRVGRRPLAADIRGYTTIPLGPAHPPTAPFQPVAGTGMGYLEAFVPLLAGFLSGLGADPSPASVPMIDDGVVVSAYRDAALASAGAREWRAV